MYTDLSEIQKQNYFNLSGELYQSASLQGRFSTSKPYNNEYYKFSPWLFSYVFDLQKGYLLCELSHEVTSSRFYGWDHEGGKLSDEITQEYLTRNTKAFIGTGNQKPIS